MACGWSGTIEQFLKISEKDLLNKLCTFIYNQSYLDASNNPLEESTLPQIRAWENCIKDLKTELSNEPLTEGYIIFEYVLPRTGGRRPDVLILLPGELIIFEFKGYPKIEQPELYQASLYVRDLSTYHSIVQKYNLKVRGCIVFPSKNEVNFIAEPESQIYLVPTTKINQFLKLFKENDTLITDTEFLEGVYQPLPSIIEAAHSIFQNESLSEIKNIKSSNFKEVIETTNKIIKEAKNNKSHHLILISGVPGAGKTYLGLKLAYESINENAIYLSGNGPLVDVLQNTLQSDTHVQALRIYKKAFFDNENLKDNIIIFDEAQRAWDAEKMNSKYSEPDIMIQIAKKKDWAVIIGLIGSGQEIHLGEESGLELWNNAIKDKNFHVHAKEENNIFSHAKTYNKVETLHLNTSLRTHNALNYFHWVELYLAGNFEEANSVAQELKKNRFILKKMHSIEEAKLFVKNLYKDSSKTYGLVTSSKNRAIKQITFSNNRSTVKQHVDYYNNPQSKFHCKNLDFAVTEFHAQGLELDMSIVIWGDDLTWNTNSKQWIFKDASLNNRAKNPKQLKLNALRVLLTRGRDGVIIVDSKKTEDS